MHKSIKIVAASILSVMATTTVHAQRQPEQWVKIATNEDDEQIYFDVSSQKQVFDSGVKTNSFRTVTTSSQGASLRGARYQADCFQGTLALQSAEVVTARGAFVRRIPLESAYKEANVPMKDTIAAAILQYACSRF
ncbi:hypothetical protein QUB68_29575 [Microcoleus sp. A006_D1]|uniref:hypothetical protein n=1 Tax=Microcoleus sp. A006_D1 TaxID=3055267 RepID=UPI002FD717B4